MSDPVTNVQIEDVLSSIRRLVSEENRTAPRAAPAEEPEAESGSFVLTPALRVAEPEPESGEAETAVPPATSADDAPWRDPDTTLFEAAEAAEAAQEDFGPDDTDRADETAEAPEAEHGDAVVDEVSGEAEDIDPLADIEPYVTDPEMHASYIDDGDTVPVFESLRDLDAAAGEVSEEEGGTEESVAEEAVAEDAVAEEAEPAEPNGADETPAAVDADETPDLSTEPEEAVDPTAALSAKIEALEAAIRQPDETWEPNEAGDGDYAGTPVETLEWEDHEAEPATGASSDTAYEPEPQPAPEPSFGTAPEPETGPELADPLDDDDVLISEEAILDEESLRELVADIVREELQGALGERITRNVRKLVRREIHRALTAQEFE